MSKNVINNPSGRKRLSEDEKFLKPISVRYTAKQLKRLTRAVKYTTMGDVWMEIDEGARPTKANKAEIAAAAKRRWKQVGKNVN